MAWFTPLTNHLLRVILQVPLDFHDFARWAPTSYKWSYNPYQWPYKWLTGTLLMWIISPHSHLDPGPTLYREIRGHTVAHINNIIRARKHAKNLPSESLIFLKGNVRTSNLYTSWGEWCLDSMFLGCEHIPSQF